MTSEDSTQTIHVEAYMVEDIEVNSNDHRLVNYDIEEYGNDIKFYMHASLNDTKVFRINPSEGKWVLPPHLSIHTLSWLVAVKKKFGEIKEDVFDLEVWIFARTTEDCKRVGKPFFARYTFTREYIMGLDLNPERFASKFVVNKS